jgi:hypothetical protein
MARIAEVTGKIEDANGEVSEFRIARPSYDVAGYHQWGNTTAVHGQNVDLLEAMVKVINLDVAPTFITGEQKVKMRSLAQMAVDAGAGDSNDDEIDAYRDALEMALQLLGMDMPEAVEED